jgi:hypothetical protein
MGRSRPKRQYLDLQGQLEDQRDSSTELDDDRETDERSGAPS